MKEHQLKTRWRTDVLIIYRCERCVSSKNVCTRVFISRVDSELCFHFWPAIWTGLLFSSRCAHLQPQAWFLGILGVLPVPAVGGRPCSPQQRPQSVMTSPALQTTAHRCRRGHKEDVKQYTNSSNVFIDCFCLFFFFVRLVICHPSDVFMLCHIYFTMGLVANLCIRLHKTCV